MTIRTLADVVRYIEDCGVVAVVRLKDGQAGHDVVTALSAGGVKVIEVTMTVPNAVGLIAELSASVPPDVLVGAGTVTDSETARRVIDAGARFVVGPVFRPELIDVCHGRDVAMMPGCFSPTEILNAWEAGADVVKVFPATTLGPGYFKDLRGPMPQLKLMPTGGVTRENAGAWIRAGAVAIGVGTALVDPALVSARRFDALTENARHFVEAVQHARSPQAVG